MAFDLLDRTIPATGVTQFNPAARPPTRTPHFHNDTKSELHNNGLPATLTSAATLAVELLLQHVEATHLVETANLLSPTEHNDDPKQVNKSHSISLLYRRPPPPSPYTGSRNSPTVDLPAPGLQVRPVPELHVEVTPPAMQRATPFLPPAIAVGLLVLQAGAAEPSAQWSFDADLIGGAIAVVGGLVFDGSLRTQLSQLRETLTRGH